MQQTTHMSVGMVSDEVMSKDGCEITASFVQPTCSAVCCEENAAYVCDTGIGSLKLITPVRPYVEYLSHINELMQIYDIHYKFPSSLSEAGGKVAKIYQSLQSAIQDTSARHAKASISLQGPQGVPSAKLVESVGMLAMS